MMESNVLGEGRGSGHTVRANGHRNGHGNGLPGQHERLLSPAPNGGKLAGATLFARNFFTHPKMLGSIIPSSRFLVRRLLNQINWSTARTIVEFGPGVGNISAEILARLRPDGRLVVFETNHDFVAYLKGHFNDPRLIVAPTSAENVGAVLRQQGIARADHVISGIPFSVMPPGVRDAVLEQTCAVLGDQGSMLIYQFSPAVKPSLQRVFREVRHDFEWLNVLPAHVFCCPACGGEEQSVDSVMSNQPASN